MGPWQKIRTGSPCERPDYMASKGKGLSFLGSLSRILAASRHFHRCRRPRPDPAAAAERAARYGLVRARVLQTSHGLSPHSDHMVTMTDRIPGLDPNGGVGYQNCPNARTADPGRSPFGAMALLCAGLIFARRASGFCPLAAMAMARQPSHKVTRSPLGRLAGSHPADSVLPVDDGFPVAARHRTTGSGHRGQHASGDRSSWQAVRRQQIGSRRCGRLVRRCWTGCVTAARQMTRP